jgi:hypothetical protein
VPRPRAIPPRHSLRPVSRRNKRGDDGASSEPGEPGCTTFAGFPRVVRRGRTSSFAGLASAVRVHRRSNTAGARSTAGLVPRHVGGADGHCLLRRPLRIHKRNCAARATHTRQAAPPLRKQRPFTPITEDTFQNAVAAKIANHCMRLLKAIGCAVEMQMDRTVLPVAAIALLVGCAADRNSFCKWIAGQRGDVAG